MIKVIIFDADGMVLTKPSRFSELLAKKTGTPLNKITKFFEKEFLLCKIGKADLREELQRYLQEWNWNRGSR